MPQSVRTRMCVGERWSTKFLGQFCLTACPVAEAADDFAAGYRMKLQRIHEMVGSEVLAQGRLVSAEHFLRGGGIDNTLLPVAASVKQQRRAWLDTDISYRKEHRAG